MTGNYTVKRFVPEQKIWRNTALLYDSSLPYFIFHCISSSPSHPSFLFSISHPSFPSNNSISTFLSPPALCSLFKGGYLFELHSPLCSDSLQGLTLFLSLSLTLKSFFYLLATQWLRWKRERSEEKGGEEGEELFSPTFQKMMTWLLSLDHASSPASIPLDK